MEVRIETVREMIATKHSRLDNFCSVCRREIKTGEKYYRTGRKGNKSCNSLRPVKRIFGVRIYCSDCIDKIYVDA